MIYGLWVKYILSTISFNSFLGVTLYEMLTKDTPFYPHKTNTIEEIARNVVYMEARFPTYISEDAKNLISSILKKKPAFRPSLEEIKQHAWLNSEIEPVKETKSFINILTNSHESSDNISSIPSPSYEIKDDEIDEQIMDLPRKKTSQQNFIFL